MQPFTESIPDKVKILFFEYQRGEWEKVLETSARNLTSESQPEQQLHWQNVSSYAKERIMAIDKQLQQLRLTAAPVDSH